MTQTFAVDNNNDLYLDVSGNIAIVRDLQAVLQDCSHVVKVRLGEVVLNTDQGLPYFETIWNGVPNPIQFEAAARNAILSVDGVLEVVSFMSNIIGENFNYTAVIRTVFGGGTISG